MIKQKSQQKPRYAHSQQLSVRYHDDELDKLENLMRKAKKKIKADFIREKSLKED